MYTMLRPKNIILKCLNTKDVIVLRKEEECREMNGKTYFKKEIYFPNFMKKFFFSFLLEFISNPYSIKWVIVFALYI